MRYFLSIKGGITLAVVAMLLTGAAIYASHLVFNVDVRGNVFLTISSGDPLQILSADGVTVIRSGDAIQFPNADVDFWGTGPTPKVKVIVKNLSNTAEKVVVSGDGTDGINVLFGTTMDNLLPAPANEFILQPAGQSGDMVMGWLALQFTPPFTPGGKQTTIRFQAMDIGGGAPEAAREVVVPNSLENAGGSSQSCFPFCGVNNKTQIVYDAGEIGGPSAYIAEIRLRPHLTEGNVFNATGLNVEIRLSHTSNNPGALSPTFANNVGADETVVLNSNNFPLSSSKTNCGASGPCDFDILFDVNDVFLFNPASGNLLVEFRIHSGAISGMGSPDGVCVAGDSVSRAYGTLNSTTGSASTCGYVTKFVLTDTPAEPVVAGPAEGSEAPDVP